VEHSAERPATCAGQARRTIVFACDANYSMQLATTLRSLAETNNRASLDIHVLTDHFPKSLRSRVSESLPPGIARIRWVTVDVERLPAHTTLDHVSTVTYARLLIPELFPGDTSKLLYLDADLLVLGDLEPLWETDLNRTPVAAARDLLDISLKAGDPRTKSMPRVRNYFNAGVLLIDLDQWRRHRVSDKAMEYLTRNPHSPFMDQDALNVACDGHWTELEDRWNFQNHFHTRIDSISEHERPAIVHFVTRIKPWNPKVISINRHFYDSVRSRTRFARTRSERLIDSGLEIWCRCKRRLRRIGDRASQVPDTSLTPARRFK
jgi:lipopolysaccharide biosynthesis glycosyltransferase